MPSQEVVAFHYAVYLQVQKVPRGKVTTYGHIAKLIFRPMNPRQVGQSLKNLPIANTDTEGNTNPYHIGNVPWWRVINAQGKISPRGNNFAEDRQAELLQSEDVEVVGKKIDLIQYGWFPPTEFDI